MTALLFTMGLRDQNASPHTCLASALSSGSFSQTRNISLSTTQEGKAKNIRHGAGIVGKLNL